MLYLSTELDFKIFHEKNIKRLKNRYGISGKNVSFLVVNIIFYHKLNDFNAKTLFYFILLTKLPKSPKFIIFAIGGEKLVQGNSKQQSIPLLRHLITLAGSQKRFAALCGVSTTVVTGWLKSGISRRGAVLAAWSQEFKDIVTYQDLRPDLNDVHKLNEIVESQKFLKWREQQLRYETQMDFAGQSPLHSLNAVREIVEQKGE